MKSTNNNLIKRDDKVLVFKFTTTTITGAVYIGDIAGFGIMTGLGFQTADITVMVGLTENGEFVDLHDADDAAYTLTSVDALDARTVDANIFPWHWAKLKSSVAQAVGTEVHGPAKT